MRDVWGGLAGWWVVLVFVFEIAPCYVVHTGPQSRHLLYSELQMSAFTPSTVVNYSGKEILLVVYFSHLFRMSVCVRRRGKGEREGKQKRRKRKRMGKPQHMCGGQGTFCTSPLPTPGFQGENSRCQAASKCLCLANQLAGPEKEFHLEAFHHTEMS